MGWSILSSQAPPPSGTEEWAVIPLTPTPGVVSYGFRVTVPSDLPVSWNTIGFFGVSASYGGVAIVFPTRSIVAVGRGANQAVQIIVPSDSEYPSILPSGIFVTFFIHKWVPAVSVELWGLS